VVRRGSLRHRTVHLQVLLYDGTKWTIGQDWNASNTWTWTPKVAGSYAIQLWVRNAGSVAEYDAWAGITTTIPAVPFITSFVPSSPGPVVMGIPVTWTVAAWGGIGSTVYKYFVYNGSTWSIGQDWSASPTWTWTPTSDGTYTFQVWVRNAGSSAEYEA